MVILIVAIIIIALLAIVTFVNRYQSYKYAKLIKKEIYIKKLDDNYTGNGHKNNEKVIERIWLDDNGNPQRKTEKIIENEKYPKEIYDEWGYDKNGYDKDGYDREGYNKNGFNKNHINVATKNKYNIHGFNYLGLHKDTGTEYDPDGFNIDRINKDNFDVNGIHQETNDIWNEKNFNIFHIHKTTGTEYDELGFDFDGLHKETNSVWNPKGFSCEGIHQETKGNYDPQGYDFHGNKVFIKMKVKEKNPNLVPFTFSISQGSQIKEDFSNSDIDKIEKLNFKKSEDIALKIELPENNLLFMYEAYLDGSDFTEKTLGVNKDRELFLEIKRKQLLFGKKTDVMKLDFSEELYSEDFYLLLDIEENATQEAVKKAYYTKIKHFPPNKNPKMFKKLRRVYEILSDPHLRNKYDTVRKHGPLIKKLKEASIESLENGKIEIATKNLQKILEIDGNDEDALLGIYRCYKKQEEYQKSEKIIQQLIDIDPLKQDYWIEYGFNSLDRISSKKTFYDYHVKEKFLAARDLNPINPLSYVGISRVYLEKKEHDTALFWIDKAINADKKIDLQDIELFIMKINILIDKNSYRFDEIREVITSLKKLKENDDMFKKYLASELMQIVYNVRRDHQFTMSIKLLEEIRYLDRNNNDIGMMIAHEKKLSRAYDAFRRYEKSSMATREFLLILDYLINRNIYTEEEDAAFEQMFRLGLRDLEGAPIYAIESAIASIRSNYYDLYDFCRDFFSRLERSMQ